MFDVSKENMETLAWCTWGILAGLLLWGLTGNVVAQRAALALATFQAFGHFALCRNVRHFPTQLRIAYALWMAVSLTPPLFFMYVILAVGTTVRVLTGYCAMARLMLLLPWNRSVPLSWARIRIIAFHPPIQGSVFGGLPLQ